jgi:hypothetical protein
MAPDTIALGAVPGEDEPQLLCPSKENMAETTPYMEYASVLPSTIRTDIV